MNRKLVLALSLFVLLCSSVYARFNSVKVKSSNGYPVAPDFILTDIDGNEFTLSLYRGKVVLLDFFATWCTPSVNQFYHLMNLHEEFGEKLVLISISPENETILRDFREAYSINWTIAKDISNVFDMYNVSYTPTVVIIDQYGYIRYRHEGLTEESVLKPEIESLLPKTIYVDDDNVAGPWNGTKEQPYQNITSGLEHASTNDTIFVCNGTYYEKVVVDKTISLTGQSRDKTFIDGNANISDLIEIKADNVIVSGFTIRNAYMTGIRVYECQDVTICDNSIVNNKQTGISLGYSKGSSIRNNKITGHGYSGSGVSIWGESHNNNVKSNEITNNTCGIAIEGGVYGTPVNNMISHNLISDNSDESIDIYESNYNVISHNKIVNNGEVGIDFYESHCNTIEGNNITQNGWWGFYAIGGISFSRSRSNIIVDNNIVNNSLKGIDLGVYSSNNVITYNYIRHNAKGVFISMSSSNNDIFHNNFLNNTEQAVVWVDVGYPASINVWDKGHPSGGNYWSDYAGVDEFSGPNHDEAGRDGIGDKPYVVDENNTDNYPLMGTFSSHGVSPRFGEGLTVTMVSNSTISDFTVARIIPMPVINITASSYYPWNEAGETRMIMFNLTGETGVGFCRMCIPKALMCPPYTVALNRGPGSPVYYNETLFNDGTHRWIYFTYPHSLTHEIWIIGKEDITHPLIANVTQYPDKDNVYPDDKVGVYANVTDDLSGVKRVILNFTTNNGTWFSKEMRNLDGDIWNATIPPFPYQTNVTYAISAEDNVNNYVTTEGTVYECQYQVIPEFPPFIILPLFMTATLLAVTVYRRRHS